MAPKELARMYTEQGMSLNEISKAIGMPMSTVRLKLLKAGVKPRTVGEGISLLVDRRVMNRHTTCEELGRMYTERGLSLKAIFRATGIPISSIRGTLLKIGVKLRTRNEGIAMLVDRGEWKGWKKGKRDPMPQETRDKIRDKRTAWGDRHAVGYRKKQTGYLEYTRGPNKGRGLHQVEAEAMLGRKLRRSECVHHIDGNRSNNARENLAVMSRSEHARLHAFERVPTMTRNQDGTFTRQQETISERAK